MQRSIGRADAVRREAEALLRDSPLTVHEVAGRLGISWQQVSAWSRRAGLRPSRATRQTVRAMLPGRQAAIRALLAVPGVDIADVAEAAGFARSSAPVFLTIRAPGHSEAACPPSRPDGTGEAPDPQRLRARLHAHIGRQIAALDAALDAAAGDPRGGIDSARILRDLGGLKKLLDDLAGEAGRGGNREEAARDACDPPPPPDPDALRAEIARRFERFVGHGTAG